MDAETERRVPDDKLGRSTVVASAQDVASFGRPASVLALVALMLGVLRPS
jgi:hypothetical protein